MMLKNNDKMDVDVDVVEFDIDTLPLTCAAVE